MVELHFALRMRTEHISMLVSGCTKPLWGCKSAWIMISLILDGTFTARSSHQEFSGRLQRKSYKESSWRTKSSHNRVDIRLRISESSWPHIRSQNVRRMCAECVISAVCLACPAWMYVGEDSIHVHLNAGEGYWFVLFHFFLEASNSHDSITFKYVFKISRMTAFIVVLVFKSLDMYT